MQNTNLKDHSLEKLTLRITGSGNIIVRIYSNSSILVSISFIGLDRDFFSIAQIPTVTAFLFDALVAAEKLI